MISSPYNVVAAYLALLSGNKKPPSKCCAAESLGDVLVIYGICANVREVADTLCTRCKAGMCITRGMALYNGTPFIRRTVQCKAYNAHVDTFRVCCSDSYLDMEFRILSDAHEYCLPLAQKLVRECGGHLFKRGQCITYITPQGDNIALEPDVWYSNYPVIEFHKDSSGVDWAVRDYTTRKE